MWSVPPRFRLLSAAIIAAVAVLPACSLGPDAYEDYHPVVAGQYYPASPTELRETVDRLLDDVSRQREPIQSHIVGLIAPHAAYEYSGKIAAHAYSQIRNKGYRTVIVMGVAHNLTFNGVATIPKGRWETPIGSVSIDSDATSVLMSTQIVTSVPAAFKSDHTIETQVPFLQRSLQDFKIVPLLIGKLNDRQELALTDAILRIIEASPRNVLVIASTDLSHYLPDDVANIKDMTAITSIKDMNLEKLVEDLQNKSCEMCSAQAVTTLMRVAQQMSAKSKILARGNLGDVTHRRQSVVGYMSAAFFVPENVFLLNKQQKKELLALARRSLKDYVNLGIKPDAAVQDSRFNEKTGVFITLKRGEVMRGCRGTTKPVTSLASGVIDMTASSARDPRFQPVQQSELGDIKIEISILGSLKKIDSINEIEVGKHGIYLCVDEACAVYLPQIATENNWDREELLRQVSRKAGLPPESWKHHDAQIFIFTAQVFSE